MKVERFQFPIQADPFKYRLPHLARSLKAFGPVNIVALGSPSTAGEGGIAPYPSRLQALLTAQYPAAAMEIINRGVGGQEAPAELNRLQTDVIDEKPCLVIWQVGTNCLAACGPTPTFFSRNDSSR